MQMNSLTLMVLLKNAIKHWYEAQFALVLLKNFELLLILFQKESKSRWNMKHLLWQFWNIYKHNHFLYFVKNILYLLLSYRLQPRHLIFLPKKVSITLSLSYSLWF